MRNVSIESVSHLVGQIYEAGYDQELWPQAIRGIRDLLGGSRSCILRFNTSVVETIASEVDHELNSRDATEALLRDPLVSWTPDLPVGVVGRWPPDHDTAAFMRREVWQDWLRPRDMDHWVVCNLLSAHGAHWVLNLHRGFKSGDFQSHDIKLLQKIVPHVLRASEIGRKLEQSSTLASGFANLPLGAIIVNGHRRMLQMNEAAEAIMMREDSPLMLSKGHIITSDQKDTAVLERFVSTACSITDGAMPGTGGTLLLPSDRESVDLRRLVLSVGPLFGDGPYGRLSERRAVIMVNEVAQWMQEGFDLHLRGLFKLTPAEARLAAALTSGQSIKEAATAGNITVKTCRTYLDRIFAKTHTHRQTDLVSLLRSTAPLGHVAPK